MSLAQLIETLNRAGVPASGWDDVRAYAGVHPVEFARIVAEAEREACAEACADAQTFEGVSARAIVMCCVSAIRDRSLRQPH